MVANETIFFFSQFDLDRSPNRVALQPEDFADELFECVHAPSL